MLAGQLGKVIFKLMNQWRGDGRLRLFVARGGWADWSHPVTAGFDGKLSEYKVHQNLLCMKLMNHIF